MSEWSSNKGCMVPWEMAATYASYNATSIKYDGKILWTLGGIDISGLVISIVCLTQ